jgi:hypothetical protein
VDQALKVPQVLKVIREQLALLVQQVQQVTRVLKVPLGQLVQLE